jgi:hypothetical protein
VTVRGPRRNESDADCNPIYTRAMTAPSIESIDRSLQRVLVQLKSLEAYAEAQLSGPPTRADRKPPRVIPSALLYPCSVTFNGAPPELRFL